MFPIPCMVTPHLFPSILTATRADSGMTTIRVVVVCVVFDMISSIWKVLAATSLVSDSTFTYWNARIVLPISEGSMFLPVAMVVSVWVDVANSTMSRAKVNFGAQFSFSGLQANSRVSLFQMKHNAGETCLRGVVSRSQQKR